MDWNEFLSMAYARLSSIEEERKNIKKDTKVLAFARACAVSLTRGQVNGIELEPNIDLVSGRIGCP